MTMRSRPRRLLVGLAGLLLAVPAAGCSDVDGTGDLQYISGDGTVLQVEPADREDPVEISGESLRGEQISLADHRGKVTVVNVWASWCPPCRAETPILAAASEKTDAVFVGIDIREASKQNALAFERDNGIEYPSIYDPAGETLLAFGPRFAPRSPPTTLVLDRQGRVAALISGQIPSTTTLTDLIEEVAAEDG